LTPCDGIVRRLHLSTTPSFFCLCQDYDQEDKRNYFSYMCPVTCLIDPFYPPLQERGFSVILSDMCPAVSGITTKDEAISCELGMCALSLAIGKIKLKEPDYSTTIEKYQSSTEPDPDDSGVLRRGGSLVIKFLENEDVPGKTSGQ
jgi:23S rRNA U2552 (ribose-2'-O)-methylase RlmE/FtsJ